MDVSASYARANRVDKVGQARVDGFGRNGMATPGQTVMLGVGPADRLVTAMPYRVNTAVGEGPIDGGAGRISIAAIGRSGGW